MTVTGGPRPLNPGTATLIASPDYTLDSTAVGADRNTHVESLTQKGAPTCPKGFRVATFLRTGADLAFDPEPFVFQIG